MLAGVLLLLWLWPPVPEWTEEIVQRTVVATIQQETPASFYVTGELGLTVTSTVKNTEVFLPGVLDWKMGTARSSVRVPGRVTYGFDVRRLGAEDIRIGEDGVVSVALPPLSVFSAEPDLEAMEIQTDAGWTRLYDEKKAEEVERQAIRRVQRVLRQQGARHLEGSVQPRVNTAAALEALLTPALEAAGVETPRFRFRIGGALVMEPEG